ncbi:MAG TPA: hypothetical protein VNH63_08420 [Gemmatimonadales bacterium]|nr:hypothetical protein [Gemmatimonadales bacterium]
MPDLRPMDMGEILDGALNIYRRHFGQFMRLSILVVWLPTAMVVYLKVRFNGDPTGIVTLFQDHTAAVILTILAVAIVWIACALVLQAGTISIISDSYLGKEPTVGSALRLGGARIGPLLLVAISKGLIIVLVYIGGALGVALLALVGRLLGQVGSFLFVFFGVIGVIWLVIYVACAYGVTSSVVVLESLDSSFDAFGRSWALTKGARLKVFGTAVVAWLIAALLPQGAVGVIAAAAGPQSASQPILVVVSSLLSVVLAPILPCALTLLYYDLRVRREAFDLQILGQQLGPA